MPETGHRDTWGAPDDGWPDFCQWCGKRLPGSKVCGFCDMLYDQEDSPNAPRL